MRAERSWYFAALAGAFLTLTMFAGESARGTAYEVRYAWVEAVPAFLSIAALLGIALVGWRPRTALAGKVIAGAALGALATHALLVVAVPLEPSETLATLAWPMLDVMGWALLPAGVLVATHEGAPPRVARAAVLVLVLVAAALAARLLWNAWVLPRPVRVGVAVSWASFVVAGGWAVAKLLLLRVAAIPRATRS